MTSCAPEAPGESGASGSGKLFLEIKEFQLFRLRSGETGPRPSIPSEALLGLPNPLIITHFLFSQLLPNYYFHTNSFHTCVASALGRFMYMRMRKRIFYV